MSKSLTDYLNEVDYSLDDLYVPSAFALGFITFIKLVHADMPTENLTPPAHLRFLDTIYDAVTKNEDVINLCHRGFAKSTLMEYLILYLAVYGGHLTEDVHIPYAIYVSDSIDNGVKKMKEGLQYKYDNSPFLQQYVTAKFTIDRWVFKNADGEDFIVNGFGIMTGIRGTRELGSRPKMALLDDLMSDEVAASPAGMKKLEEAVNGAIEHALDPNTRMVIWSGTPFNSKDAIVKGVESGAYKVNVFPVAQEFPVDENYFRGSWPDRFSYHAVKRAYDKAMKTGTIANFNRELMLRIMSDEDRLIQDHDIQWYSFNDLIARKSQFNYYITTDFATSEKTAADFSVISVWALSNNGQWFWVDGICARQTMDKNINDLFRLAQKWKPQNVGIEVSGQQGGFISWIQSEMLQRNIFFMLASDNNSGAPGIRPFSNKLQRFNVVVPWFKGKLIFLPHEMKDHPAIVEAVEEMSLLSVSGFKSKHDDWADTASMLAVMQTWRPSEEPILFQDSNDMWAFEDDISKGHGNDSYIV